MLDHHVGYLQLGESLGGSQTGCEALTPFWLLQCYSVPLKEGDVIIAGTDGVWDNLFDPECAALVSQTQGKGQNPAQSAEALARCAHMRYASNPTQIPASLGQGSSIQNSSPFIDAYLTSDSVLCTLMPVRLKESSLCSRSTDYLHKGMSGNSCT